MIWRQHCQILCSSVLSSGIWVRQIQDQNHSFSAELSCAGAIVPNLVTHTCGMRCMKVSGHGDYRPCARVYEDICGYKMLW